MDVTECDRTQKTVRQNYLVTASDGVEMPDHCTGVGSKPA